MILALDDGLDLPLVRGGGGGQVAVWADLSISEEILAVTRTAGWGSREFVSSCVSVESSRASQLHSKYGLRSPSICNTLVHDRHRRTSIGQIRSTTQKIVIVFGSEKWPVAEAR